MAHHELRNDKTCLNCFHVVENRFCPNCGQENTETRKSFGHLITHFVEDFTHYDNAFWTTIKYLLFRPALLTKEYLSGKRQLFVPPVKLYIFVSFVTFFLLSILPSEFDSISEKESVKKPTTEKKAEADEKVKVSKNAAIITADQDSQQAIDSILNKEKLNERLDLGEYASLAAYDSIQKSKLVEKRNGFVVSWIKKKVIEVRLKAKEKDDFLEQFKNALFRSIPKALFLYMPFFALGLWIFHDKERWYYFDHGIFTLHYFSFLLFTFSIYTLFANLALGLNHPVTNSIDAFLNLGLLVWWFFYFFRSHRRFYGESRFISRLKSMVLFIINMVFISIFLLVLMAISALSVH